MSQLWSLVILLAVSCSPGIGETIDGFSWTEETVRADQVPARNSWTFLPRWRVGASPVEIVRVVPSCQCAGVMLLLDDGRELSLGPIPQGSAGTARITVAGRQTLEELESSVTVVWRRPEAAEMYASTVKLTLRYEKVYEISPANLVRSQVPPGETVPFAVTLRALRPVLVQDLEVEAVDGIDVDELIQETRDGAWNLTMRGQIRCPEGSSPFLVGRLSLKGIDPRPPDVPVHVGWLPAVQVEPAGVLRFDPTEEGPVANARLNFATMAKATGIRRLEIEGSSDPGAIDASWSPDPGGEIRIRLRGRFKDSATSAQGVVRVVPEAVGLGEIRIPWLYLKPRGQPRQESRPSDDER